MTAHLGASAAHRSVSPELTAVIGMWGDAGERGRLPSFQVAQLGHVGQEGGSDDGADIDFEPGRLGLTARTPEL